jgi:hypothetical protein
MIDNSIFLIGIIYEWSFLIVVGGILALVCFAHARGERDHKIWEEKNKTTLEILGGQPWDFIDFDKAAAMAAKIDAESDAERSKYLELVAALTNLMKQEVDADKRAVLLEASSLLKFMAKGHHVSKLTSHPTLKVWYENATVVAEIARIRSDKAARIERGRV